MKIEEAEVAIAKILDAVERENDVWVQRIEIDVVEVSSLNDKHPKFSRRITLELLRRGGWV